MGPNWKKDRRFPILVKWLDCHARLSLQVHPPADIASSLNGEPKTENWYIVNCTEEAGIILGLKKGVTKLQFQEALKQNSAENLCHKIPSKPNDSVLVESGRMHAIDAGNLILEIQQNSDTTFRVYDWGRNGEDGKPRNLHIEESMKCIDFNDYEPCTMTTCTDLGEYTIAQSELFRIRKFNLAKGSKTEIKKPLNDQRFPIYIANVDDSKFYIVPLIGSGLWDIIWGYIAIESDLKTIKGAVLIIKEKLQV